MAEIDQPDLTTLTVQLLSAYVANNSVASEDLATLIVTTRAALEGKPSQEGAAEQAQEHVPAVTVRKSLGSRDHLLSMIDGKPYKTLKRHIARHGLTPAEYRSRYKLPADYPMVAPGYSEQRREVAKKLGLGRKPASSAADGSVGANEATSAAASSVERSAENKATRRTRGAAADPQAAPEAQASPSPVKATSRSAKASAAKAKSPGRRALKAGAKTNGESAPRSAAEASGTRAKEARKPRAKRSHEGSEKLTPRRGARRTTGVPSTERLPRNQKQRAPKAGDGSLHDGTSESVIMRQGGPRAPMRIAQASWPWEGGHPVRHGRPPPETE